MCYQSQVHLCNDSLVPEDKLFLSLSPVNQAMGTFCLFNTENPRGKGKKKGVWAPLSCLPGITDWVQEQLCASCSKHVLLVLKTKPGSARGKAVLPRVPPHACLLHHQRVRLIICLLGTITGRLAAFSLVNVNIVSRTRYLRCEIRCY